MNARRDDEINYKRINPYTETNIIRISPSIHPNCCSSEENNYSLRMKVTSSFSSDCCIIINFMDSEFERKKLHKP